MFGHQTVRWTAHHQDGTHTSVDFRSVFDPTENVCAYALCYVTCRQPMNVSVRIGTNDTGKMWIGGKLVYDHAHDGQAILDRDIIVTALPQGTTPILVKVCNGRVNWGFVLRVTDRDGDPVEGLTIGLSPSG